MYRYEFYSRGDKKWVKISPKKSRQGSKQEDEYWWRIEAEIEAPKESILGKIIIKFTEEL